MRKPTPALCLLLLSPLLLPSPLRADDSPATSAASLPLPATSPTLSLQDADQIAIFGDSITQQIRYSQYLQEYLLMTQPRQNLRVVQFGWAGEQLPAFLQREPNDVGWFHPTVATSCYGMNDAGYAGYSPQRLADYAKNTQTLIDILKKQNVRFIVIGSPGCIDPDFMAKAQPTVPNYNNALKDLRDAAQKVAADNAVAFADVYTPMLNVMNQAKAAYGKSYPIAPDGVHPLATGHLIMAYAFLKALNVDPNIGTFTVNLANNTATASPGHTVLSFNNNTLTLLSTRYPFCFPTLSTKLSDPENPRGILPFLPFNNDLNRLILQIPDATAPFYKISWGPTSKIFAGADLQTGINLADQFLDNPFTPQFGKINEMMRTTQYNEVPLTKEVIHSKNPAALQGEAADADQAQKILAAITPIKHVIKIEIADSPPTPTSAPTTQALLPQQ